MRTIVCTWGGAEFVPIRTLQQTCARAFKVGEKYSIDVIEERSAASHKQYFAAVNEAWHNLSEEAMAQYSTPDHLRKWALIKAGYRRETTFVLDSEEHAIANAAFLRSLDDTAVIVVKGNVVKFYVAKSQRTGTGGMAKDEFERSKRDVLDILALNIKVTRTDLQRAGRANANG